MAESVIPVDLFNPGQVFACIGFAEAAEVLLGDAEGVFDWSDPAGVVFRLRAAGDEAPASRVLAFLDRAELRVLAPKGSQALAAWMDGWGAPPVAIDREAGYPYPDRGKSDILCCELFDPTHALRIDHWGDQTCRESLKLWAGAGGYPGATRVSDALALARGRYLSNGLADPFGLSATTAKKSSVRLDWRRDYIPIDLGFSLDKHGAMHLATCFPVTEVLGALGLNNARPFRRDATRYLYQVPGAPAGLSNAYLPLPLLRAMLGCAAAPWPSRTFCAVLGRPNDYDRTFTTVTEETLA